MISPAKIQVRFADLDTMGHVNNAIYLSYFENARVHYFNQLLGLDWDWRKFGCLVVKNEVNYFLPVFLQDQPEVEMLLESVGTKSFTLLYEVKVNGNVVTTGRSVMVCFDAKANATIPVSDEWKHALAQLRVASN